MTVVIEHRRYASVDTAVTNLTGHRGEWKIMNGFYVGGVKRGNRPVNVNDIMRDDPEFYVLLRGEGRLFLNCSLPEKYATLGTHSNRMFLAVSDLMLSKYIYR